jgi:hypothetical protein
MPKKEKQRCFLKIHKKPKKRIFDGKVQLLIHALMQPVQKRKYDEYF